MFFDRTGGKRSTRAVKTSTTKTFRAPYRGYVRSTVPGFPKEGQAIVLDNWFPTTEGARIRKGSTKHATIGGSVLHVRGYEAGITSKLFAADENNIYDVTSPADPDVSPSAAVSSLTSGDWSSIQFQTSGGTFLVMVNGADDMEQYDGSSWTAINTGSSPAITGVDTADLSQLWAFKRRIFLIEEGTMSAWYLPADSIAGAAAELPLGGIFSLGGSLLFGGTWSQDSGDGLDDYCVFVTNKGEVAVYQGTDPSSASTWEIVGVYRIGQPLHKNAHFRAGGDLAVVTDEGIVPISAAVSKDRAALGQYAVTRPIEEQWRIYMKSRTGLSIPFSCVLWQSASMLLVGMPTDTGQDVKALAANAVTGAWSSGFTGWDVQCSCIWDDGLYFGTGSSTVMQGDVGGTDDGTAYQAVALGSFDMMKSPAEKSAIHARATIKTNYPYTFTLFCNSDYVVEVPTAGAADDIDGGAVWGGGVWDTMVWQVAGSEETKEVTSEWQNVNGSGFVLAAGISITIGDDVAPDIELTGIELVFEVGEIMG